MTAFSQAALLFIWVIAASDAKLFGQHRVPDATAPIPDQGAESDKTPEINQRARGSVAFRDGKRRTQLIEVDAVCPTFERLLAVADSRGRFSFAFDQNRMLDVALTQGCVLQVHLEGYRSKQIDLAGLGSKSGRKLGTIVEEVLPQDPRGLFSASESEASPAENRLLERSADKASKQDWTAAKKLLQELLSEHPGHSCAWLNLGVLQQIEGDVSAAEESYLQATHADPTFAIPLIRAARLELSAAHYRESAVHSQSAIDLNPEAFPEAYALNASANLSLGRATAAERSARAGLALDATNQYPELEYVLGSVLKARNETASAREHLRRYIQLAPTGPNVAAAKSELQETLAADDGSARSAAIADERFRGPTELILTTDAFPEMDAVRRANGPILGTASDYTCLESVQASRSDAKGHSIELGTIRVDVAVFGGQETYGPPDGRRFGNGPQRDLLGYSFSTTGLFSSLARSVMGGKTLVIEPVGQFDLEGDSVIRYNFHSFPNAASWTITYGGQTGVAAEDGWFLVDKESLVLRRIFVRAASIPKELGLVVLSALVDYESETLGGHRLCLPTLATVYAGERSGLTRRSMISFDHCRAFRAESTLSFGDEATGSLEGGVVPVLPRLPDGFTIIVELGASVSLAGNGSFTATVVQPVFVKGRELISRGAMVEGRVRAKRKSSVVLQLDRVRTTDGWVPFYAQLVSIVSKQDVEIQSGPLPETGDSPGGGDQDKSKIHVPGVATLALRSDSATLMAGTRMVWRTEPLEPVVGGRGDGLHH